jgi:hypothetical protein
MVGADDIRRDILKYPQNVVVGVGADDRNVATEQ